MSLKATFEKKTFHFKQPSGTSRGVLTEKNAWFISLSDDEKPGIFGLGECSVIPGLTPEFKSIDSYQKLVSDLCLKIKQGNFDCTTISLLYGDLTPFSSILFGLETAVLDLKNGGNAFFYDTKFTRGEFKIPINGLIWMGSEAFMQQQIEEKLGEGYDCIKMKIGAIDFDNEYKILAALRSRFDASVLTLRVDANGAFSTAEALEKLDKLAALDLHSIEQPIKAGQWQAMAELCQKTKLPIALDEELIGIVGKENKKNLLETIRPQYIILKPSLHGGFSGSKEWIALANELHINWWITSALESNVGLNAIAQFTATFPIDVAQGLGTGSLYLENTPTKMRTQGGFLTFEPGEID